MERVGIYEAKAKLSDLVERVSRGGEVTITKHGKAVAKLVRARAEKRIDRSALMREIRAFSKTIKLRKKISLRLLRGFAEEGRD